MKKILSVFLAIIIVMSFSVQAFALTYSEALATRNEEYSDFYEQLAQFDVNGSNRIDPADARLTLRYSAGLEESGVNVDKMDVDGDGEITAIDARHILRLSVELDNILQYIPVEDQIACFNSLVNLPRAASSSSATNYYYLYANTVDNIGNVTIKDSDGVIKALNDGMNKIAESDADKVDFAQTLKSSFYSNTSSYISSENTYISPSGSATYGHASNYLPVILNSEKKDEHISSYLTVDDIEKIEYKSNQNYTFIRYGTKYDSSINKTVIDKSVVYYTKEVTGLDSMTIYLKPDNNIAGAHTSKAFIIEDEDAIMAALNGVDDDFNFDDFKDYGDFDFDMKTSLNSFNYHDTAITVYFYPDTGNIVAVHYDKSINYTIKLWMDIYIKFNELVGGMIDISMLFGKPLVDAAGNIYITSSEQSVQDFFFIRNVVE